MIAAEQKQITAADARRRRAECAELELRIRLRIAREKISALETAEKKRQRTLIESTGERLVKPGNLYGQFNLLEQLARDPALVTLALAKKIFRAGPAVNR
jgi:hypothetical protein